jgi:hypothetical protein
MKKLGMLFVMLAVVCVCVPSYGYMLVYNMSGSYKTLETTAEILYSSSFKGYLVMDVNDANGAINQSTAIIYGKNAGGGKVYITVSDVVYACGQYGQYMNIELYMKDYQFDTVMIGKVKTMDVGGSLFTGVGTSLKGHLLFYEDGYLLDNTQYFTGSGTSSLSLNKSRTKEANVYGDTVDYIVNEYQSLLTGKGYVGI